jgi:hypothetical protein
MQDRALFSLYVRNRVMPNKPPFGVCAPRIYMLRYFSELPCGNEQADAVFAFAYRYAIFI